MKVFVTVGTTEFDELIRIVDSDEALDALSKGGSFSVLSQIGKGKFEPSHCQWYRFKSSLSEDIASADLVITHAGAGSILQCVRDYSKMTIAVINPSLMDNHQDELASAMQEEGYLIACYPKDLISEIGKVFNRTLKKYPIQDQTKLMDLFVSELENCKRNL